MERGLIQLYTGNGKGKTTAALGQALRARGHGWRVAVVCFLKGSDRYGELRAAADLGIEVYQVGRDDFVDPINPDPLDVELARQGLERAGELAVSGRYQLLILDEVVVAVAFGLLRQEQLLDFLQSKPPALEVVLTGRYALPELVERSDLVSYVQEVKHHYQRGLPARPGIEY